MSLAQQLFRYLLAGGFATLGHYGVLILLVEGGWMAPTPASSFAFAIGGVLSYHLNRRLTFDSGRPHAETALNFAAVAFSGFLITTLLMHILTERMGLGYMAAQIQTTVVVFVWTFAANKIWTFRPLSEEEEEAPMLLLGPPSQI